MNTVQLECFLAVAENLNFARAAEEIHITQPAVTHQINSLETELGVKLFRRTTRTVALTMDGLNFVSDAKSILQSMHMAKSRLQLKQGMPFSVFSIGCHSVLEYTFFPEILRSLTERYPDVHPMIKTIPMRVLETLLENETIDIMLDFKQDGDKKRSWEYHELISVETVCALPLEHRFASRGYIEYEELSEEKLVLLEPRKIPSPIFALQAPLVSRHSPADLYFCEDFESALTLTAAGLGATILPGVRSMEVQGLRYVPIKDSPKLSYGVCYKAHNRTAVMKYFIELAQKVLRG